MSKVLRKLEEMDKFLDDPKKALEFFNSEVKPALEESKADFERQRKELDREFKLREVKRRRIEAEYNRRIDELRRDYS